MHWKPIVHAIGVLLTVFSAFFLIPLLGSLIWDDGVDTLDWALLPPGVLRVTTFAFAMTALATLLLGQALGTLGSEKMARLGEWDSLYVVGAGWLLCAIVGSAPFLLTGVTRDPTVAFFESMSGITTTGFSALPGPLEQYAPSIHLWRAGLQFAGGMGLVVIAVAVISRLTEGGRRMMIGETGREDIQFTARLTHTARALFAVYVLLNAAFFLMFWLSMHYTGARFGWKDSAFHALVHAMAGVATGGYSSLSNSIAGFESTTVSLVALACMVAGGFSFPLYLRLWHGAWRPVLRMGVVRFYLALLIVPAILIVARLIVAGHPAGQAVLDGSFMSVSSLVGEGFTTTDAGPFPADVRVLLVLLMVTGGMVGSTSGAIKQARILVFLQMVWSELRKLLHPHGVVPVKTEGRILPEAHARRLEVFFLLYLAFLFGGAVFFTSVGFDVESAFAGTAATLGNVGYAWHGFLGGYADPVGPAARLGGILLMWFGRLEIFAALVIFLPATYRE
jgi:trk system potassium uptake protein TrkH